MITGELFRAFVQQAWSGPAASGTDMGDIMQQQQQQQWGHSQSNANAPNTIVTRAAGTGVTGPLGSPLDCPDLLMAYYNASCNALLRYHCDMPILQPRTTYSLPRRVSPVSVGHSRGRPQQHQRPPPPSYWHATFGSGGHHPSSSHMHVPHDEASSSPSADATYRPERFTNLRGPTVMLADRHVHSTLYYTDEHNTFSNTYDGDRIEVPVQEGRPSWSPQQMRYRWASGSSGSDNIRPRASSSIAPNALNYGGIAEGDIDEDEDVVEGRLTIQLDTQHTHLQRGVTSSSLRQSSHLMHPRHVHSHSNSNTDNHHQGRHHGGTPDVVSSGTMIHGGSGGESDGTSSRGGE